MNKIPKNYLPKLNTRETQEAYFLLVNELIKEIEQNLDVFQVRQPKISTSKISATGILENGDRMINFDTSNDNSIYTLYSEYKYWLVNSIKKLEIKNNHGIFCITNSIKRDNEITNAKSIEENLLQIEYRYDNENKIFEKANELLKIIVKIFRNIESKILSKYQVLVKTISKEIDIIEFKKTENRKSLEAIIMDVAIEKKMFCIIDKKLPSDKGSFKNNFELFLIGLSTEIGIPCPLLLIQDRKTLEDIEPNISESESIMEEYIFKKNIFKNGERRTINITINIDLLALIILNKSHILEIQSGKNINEIEKILSRSDAKHL